ncbi:MAG: S8 family serine peptidase [Bacteroidota bacterium]
MRFLLFLLCSFSTLLLAQNTPPDPIDDIYLPIFNAYESKLEELGYPVGRAGNAAYVPGQYVLQYSGPNAAADFAADLNKLKQDFGANNVSVIGECGCSSEYKLYTVEITTIGGEEKGKRGKERVASSLGKEEVEPNYYVVPELEQLQDHPAFNQLPPNFAVVPSGKPAAPVDIAILDTGIDPYFQHPQVTNGYAPLYLWENDDPNATNDPFCLPNDLFGWDFINDDNSPVDDHSHGTHIASRIAQQLADNAPNVNYRFMSVKMLDHDGVGNTFTAACAVLYAAHHEVDVINASWGFYGEPDKILYDAFAFAEAQGVATMTSAGNFRKDLSQVRHYPSGFAQQKKKPLKSIFYSSASRTGSALWPLTNFRVNPAASGSHFMASPGANLLGFLPHHFGVPGNQGRKSGTSISVPLSAALAAHYKHLHPGVDPTMLRSVLVAEIEAQGTNGTFNYQGSVIPYKVFNWVTLP